ncbi:MAG: hypothetical protein H7039_21355 [Bryobacteraceae bacterium]|nr:hypothetical protein [Bryobacteraceae bacterium]
MRWPCRWLDSETLHLAILWFAALLIPGEQRAEWLAEWRSELWYVRRNRCAFCLGAIQDAVWVRRNTPEIDGGKDVRLGSPVTCILLLSVLAAFSAFFAFRLPGARELMPWSSNVDEQNLVTIGSAGRSAARSPTVTVAGYRSLKVGLKDVLRETAFYRPIRARVEIARQQTAELSVALTTRNVFDLLNLPEPVTNLARRPEAPALILDQAAWRKYYNSDPHIAGRVLVVGGSKVFVAGVVPLSLRLPVSVDAWLVNDAQQAELHPQTKGFVFARLRPASTFAKPGLRWHVSVPDGQGGSDRFECASVARVDLLFAHLLMIFVALLILPVATSLELGEYPCNPHAASLTIRLRRWVFLAVKIPLLMVVVFCGILDLGALTSMPIQPHGLLFGYVLAFRWALSDQRKRCPICLRLVTNPARIGSSSNTFLEWYGTELMCTRGHGLLHVPEIPATYSTQRWLDLDPSWASLFSSRKV